MGVFGPHAGLMHHAVSSVLLLNLHAANKATSLSLSEAKCMEMFHVFPMMPPYIPWFCASDSTSLTSSCTNLIFYQCIKHIK